ncbi:DUF1016 N-terminal domain-containing protein [Massilia sp. DJPM01]|uniref:DUF1016 N-terminal domain-containing protein n=1 Tax=Massilia sp. DJPM01 TaxID=3024404 RepID=UPI0035A3598B
MVAVLAKQLEAEYGRGVGVKNLYRVLRFSVLFDSEEVFYALSRQLSWTHFRCLMYIDDLFKRTRGASRRGLVACCIR